MKTLTAVDIQGILTCLPHRYPFLLVDKVIELEPNISIRAIKNVTINEPFFQGHFPDKPIMPGVLILEAMAQTAAILEFYSFQITKKPSENSHYYLAGVDKAKFKAFVTPGDQLVLQVTVNWERKSFLKCSAVASVKQKIVCSAEITGVKQLVVNE